MKVKEGWDGWTHYRPQNIRCVMVEVVELANLYATSLSLMGGCFSVLALFDHVIMSQSVPFRAEPMFFSR